MTKEQRNICMKEYLAKNKVLINQQRSLRRKYLKENDVEEFERRNNEQKKRQHKYQEANKDIIAAKAKAKNYWTNDDKKQYRKKWNQVNFLKAAIKATKDRAHMKNLPFDLTAEWYEEQFEKGCAVTGLPLDRYGCKSAFTAHIDREIPEKGYTQANCRLVCGCYNLAKKYWTHEDVLKMATALVNFSNTIKEEDKENNE
jgi:hypothetical protein